MKRIGFLALLPLMAAPPRVGAQSRSSGAPVHVIDTIIVVTENVFDPVEARSNLLFRMANGIRFTTRAGIVRRELLFKPGEVYDSAKDGRARFTPHTSFDDGNVRAEAPARRSIEVRALVLF